MVVAETEADLAIAKDSRPVTIIVSRLGYVDLPHYLHRVQTRVKGKGQFLSVQRRGREYKTSNPADNA